MYIKVFIQSTSFDTTKHFISFTDVTGLFPTCLKMYIIGIMDHKIDPGRFSICNLFILGGVK